VADFWGFNVCSGISVTLPWGVVNPKHEWPNAEKDKIDSRIKKAADRFYKTLSSIKAPEPSLKKLLIFRLVRSAHKHSIERTRDYEYFRDNGWFSLPYYYDIKLSWYKGLLGVLVDRWQTKQSKKLKVSDENSMN